MENQLNSCFWKINKKTISAKNVELDEEIAHFRIYFVYFLYRSQ